MQVPSGMGAGSCQLGSALLGKRRLRRRRLPCTGGSTLLSKGLGSNILFYSHFKSAGLRGQLLFSWPLMSRENGTR